MRLQEKVNVMKLTMLALLGLGLFFSGSVRGQSFTNNANTAIPDGNPVGYVSTLTVSGLTNVSSIQVTLDITGGFNGDLYAYLVGPNGGFAVLLNRSGVNSGSTYGYNNTGFQVTFSDTAAYDIHNYQLHTPTYISGALQGTWQPDGGNINPQSSPSSFPAAQMKAIP